MVSVKKSVWIKWNVNATLLQQANSKVLDVRTLRLGSSGKAINTLMANEEELKVLLPLVLGVDPNSSNTNWTNIVNMYLNSLSVIIPNDGKELNIGFTYDISLSRVKENIKTLSVSIGKEFKTNEELAEYCEGYKGTTPNVEEHKKYLYGFPINVSDYIVWRYALLHRDVANTLELASKSLKIKFYLFDETRAKQIAKNKQTVLDQARKMYIDVIGKGEETNMILFMIDQYVEGDETYVKNTKLDSFISSNPAKFVEIMKDSNLKTKYMIERLIRKGILKRYENSAMIVDNEDVSIVIGNTLDEAVSFFTSSSPDKVAQRNEYINKYKLSANNV